LYKYINYEAAKIGLSEHIDINYFKNTINNEKENSIKSFYFFVENEKLLSFYNSIYTNLNNVFDNPENRIFKNNDINLILLKYFYTNNTRFIKCFYSVIILKSFIQSNYSFEDINEDYVNSNIVLSKACDLYKNFTIFYNLYSIYQLDYEDTKIRSHFLVLLEYLSIKKIFETKII
jgi:hypothetical protein